MTEDATFSAQDVMSWSQLRALLAEKEAQAELQRQQREMLIFVRNFLGVLSPDVKAELLEKLSNAVTVAEEVRIHLDLLHNELVNLKRINKCHDFFVDYQRASRNDFGWSSTPAAKEAVLNIGSQANSEHILDGQQSLRGMIDDWTNQVAPIVENTGERPSKSERYCSKLHSTLIQSYPGSNAAVAFLENALRYKESIANKNESSAQDALAKIKLVWPDLQQKVADNPHSYTAKKLAGIALDDQAQCKEVILGQSTEQLERLLLLISKDTAQKKMKQCVSVLDKLDPKHVFAGLSEALGEDCLLSDAQQTSLKQLQGHVKSIVKIEQPESRSRFSLSGMERMRNSVSALEANDDEYDGDVSAFAIGGSPHADKRAVNFIEMAKEIADALQNPTLPFGDIRRVFQYDPRYFTSDELIEKIKQQDDKIRALYQSAQQAEPGLQQVGDIVLNMGAFGLAKQQRKALTDALKVVLEREQQAQQLLNLLQDEFVDERDLFDLIKQFDFSSWNNPNAKKLSDSFMRMYCNQYSDFTPSGCDSIDIKGQLIQGEMDLEHIGKFRFTDCVFRYDNMSPSVVLPPSHLENCAFRPGADCSKTTRIVVNLKRVLLQQKLGVHSTPEVLSSLDVYHEDARPGARMAVKELSFGVQGHLTMGLLALDACAVTLQGRSNTKDPQSIIEDCELRSSTLAIDSTDLMVSQCSVARSTIQSKASTLGFVGGDFTDTRFDLHSTHLILHPQNSQTLQSAVQCLQRSVYRDASSRLTLNLPDDVLQADEKNKKEVRALFTSLAEKFSAVKLTVSPKNADELDRYLQLWHSGIATRVSMDLTLPEGTTAEQLAALCHVLHQKQIKATVDLSHVNEKSIEFDPDLNLQHVMLRNTGASKQLTFTGHSMPALSKGFDGTVNASGVTVRRTTRMSVRDTYNKIQHVNCNDLEVDVQTAWMHKASFERCGGQLTISGIDPVEQQELVSEVITAADTQPVLVTDLMIQSPGLAVSLKNAVLVGLRLEGCQSLSVDKGVRIMATAQHPVTIKGLTDQLCERLEQPLVLTADTDSAVVNIDHASCVALLKAGKLKCDTKVLQSIKTQLTEEQKTQYQVHLEAAGLSATQTGVFETGLAGELDERLEGIAGKSDVERGALAFLCQHSGLTPEEVIDHVLTESTRFNNKLKMYNPNEEQQEAQRRIQVTMNAHRLHHTRIRVLALRYADAFNSTFLAGDFKNNSSALSEVMADYPKLMSYLRSEPGFQRHFFARLSVAPDRVEEVLARLEAVSESVQAALGTTQSVTEVAESTADLLQSQDHHKVAAALQGDNKAVMVDSLLPMIESLHGYLDETHYGVLTFPWSDLYKKRSQVKQTLRALVGNKNGDIASVSSIKEALLAQNLEDIVSQVAKTRARLESMQGVHDAESAKLYNAGYRYKKAIDQAHCRLELNGVMLKNYQSMFDDTRGANKKTCSQQFSTALDALSLQSPAMALGLCHLAQHALNAQGMALSHVAQGEDEGDDSALELAYRSLSDEQRETVATVFTQLSQSLDAVQPSTGVAQAARGFLSLLTQGQSAAERVLLWLQACFMQVKPAQQEQQAAEQAQRSDQRSSFKSLVEQHIKQASDGYNGALDRAGQLLSRYVPKPGSDMGQLKGQAKSALRVIYRAVRGYQTDSPEKFQAQLGHFNHLLQCILSPGSGSVAEALKAFDPQLQAHRCVRSLGEMSQTSLRRLTMSVFRRGQAESFKGMLHLLQGELQSVLPREKALMTAAQVTELRERQVDEIVDLAGQVQGVVKQARVKACDQAMPASSCQVTKAEGAAYLNGLGASDTVASTVKAGLFSLPERRRLVAQDGAHQQVDPWLQAQVAVGGA